MKKTLSLIIILVITIGCNSQDNKNKRLINDFIEEIILKKKSSIEELNKYIDFNKNSLNNNNNEIINFNINFLNTEINTRSYSILKYNEFKKEKEFKEFKIHYNNLNNVYCVVSRDKYITLFVVENNRILAFFTGIVKNKDRIIPYLLN